MCRCDAGGRGQSLGTPTTWPAQQPAVAENDARANSAFTSVTSGFYLRVNLWIDTLENTSGTSDIKE